MDFKRATLMMAVTELASIDLIVSVVVNIFCIACLPLLGIKWINSAKGGRK